ncbi:MAG: sulfatase-like hydrolase/transferase [Planctomycetes bacterium]|nr:sulfatase-like hydrolase/transferase [Planctomycetota bacterium]
MPARSPFRRTPLGPIVVARCAMAVGVVSVGVAFVSCGSDPPAARPNVLVILMDTTRADRCGFLGYARPTTPRLDAFAKDAVRFSDFWSPASWTGPSHGTLFTGLRPEHHRLYNDGSTALAPEYETLAELLSTAGYRTASYSNNPYVAAEFGLTQGFQTDRALFRIPGRTYPWARDTHTAALDWMLSTSAGDADRPFLCFINDMEPHYPYHPPRGVESRFVRPTTPPEAVESVRDLVFPRSLGLCLGVEPWAPGEKDALSDLYDAEVATLDAEVGTLLDGLRAAGLLDRTLIVVLSDHGEGLADHGWIEHGVRMDRELLRVPLLLRLPGRFDGGRTVKQVVRMEDVFPTVLDACGVDSPPCDGVPLTRDLDGRIAYGFDGGYVTWADKAAGIYPKADVTAIRSGRRSVFDGTFHMVVPDTGPTTLYDVSADPGEKNDLAGTRPDVESRLRELLRAAHGR